MTEQEYEAEIIRLHITIEAKDECIEEMQEEVSKLKSSNKCLHEKLLDFNKNSQRLHFMIKNKYMFWEEFDRVEIRDQQGNYKGAGKDHISAIDDAMGKEI